MTKEKKDEGFAKLPTMKEVKDFMQSLKAFLFATSIEKSQYFLHVKGDLKKEASKPVKFAIGVVFSAVFFFVIWGGLAPLDSAIMAQGSVVLSGNRQVIQHDSGGIIKAILVKDGDTVSANQPLIELNPTQAAASVNISLSQLRTSLAIERRLLAEESGFDSMDFTSEYLDPNDQEVQRLIANQNQLFSLRKAMLQGKLDSINKQIEQLQEKMIGEKGQLKSVQSQLSTARANAADAEKLFKTGAVNKLYLMQNQNEVQRLEGSESQVKASIAVTEQSIIEAQIQLLNSKNEFMHRIEEEYKQNHVMLLESEQKYLHAKEMLDRTIIRSPVDGVISSTSYHTIGGVISPGMKIMEITPQNDDLIIDAFVSPNEVNSLRVGIPVKIQLNPYKQRLVPRIDGEVIYVSANTIVHEQGAAKNEFFLVKIKINHKAIASLNTDVKLYPGMPVTVFIIRGTRTFLQYMLSPIIDSFHKAFKEV